MSYVKVDEGPKPLVHDSTITSTGFIPMRGVLEQPMSWIRCPMCANPDLKVCNCDLLNYFCGSDECEWRHINHTHCKGKIASTNKHIPGDPVPRDLNTNAITGRAIRKSYYTDTSRSNVDASSRMR